MLWSNNVNEVDDNAGPSEPTSQDDSEHDPNWVAKYEDFSHNDATEDSHSDSDTPSYTEDPLKELGLYQYGEDVSTWPFDRLFADDQWQDQAITLVNNTHNFSGPIPGPTSAVANHLIEYFMRYWPAEVLQRVLDETNR